MANLLVWPHGHHCSRRGGFSQLQVAPPCTFCYFDERIPSSCCDSCFILTEFTKRVCIVLLVEEQQLYWSKSSSRLKVKNSTKAIKIVVPCAELYLRRYCQRNNTLDCLLRAHAGCANALSFKQGTTKVSMYVPTQQSFKLRRKPIFFLDMPNLRRRQLLRSRVIVWYGSRGQRVSTV